MTPIPNVALRRMEAKRRELDEARSRVVLLEAELRGWEDAAQAFGFNQVRAAPESEAVKPEAHSGRRKRGLNARSKATLAGMAKDYPKDLSFDEIEQHSERAGFPVERATLRSQMALYANMGFVERIGSGRFRITLAGAEAADVTLPPPSDQAEGVRPEPDRRTRTDEAEQA